MRLSPLTENDCQLALKWRNEDIRHLRTPFFLTEEMQHDFYKNVICNRSSPHRYFGIRNDHLIGMGGLINIQWENSIAEISLILKPDERDKGNGTKAVQLLLNMAFNDMGLKTIYGECYTCNMAKDFWRKITAKYNGYGVLLPNRKYWDGKYWDSFYFSIDKRDFKND